MRFITSRMTVQLRRPLPVFRRQKAVGGRRKTARFFQQQDSSLTSRRWRCESFTGHQADCGMRKSKCGLKTAGVAEPADAAGREPAGSKRESANLSARTNIGVKGRQRPACLGRRRSLVQVQGPRPDSRDEYRVDTGPQYPALSTQYTIRPRGVTDARRCPKPQDPVRFPTGAPDDFRLEISDCRLQGA